MKSVSNYATELLLPVKGAFGHQRCNTEQSCPSAGCTHTDRQTDARWKHTEEKEEQKGSKAERV